MLFAKTIWHTGFVILHSERPTASKCHREAMSTFDKVIPFAHSEGMSELSGSYKACEAGTLLKLAAARLVSRNHLAGVVLAAHICTHGCFRPVAEAPSPC